MLKRLTVSGLASRNSDTGILGFGVWVAEVLDWLGRRGFQVKVSAFKTSGFGFRFSLYSLDASARQLAT